MTRNDEEPPEEMPCLECDGTGLGPCDGPCPECDGTGTAPPDSEGEGDDE